MPQALTSRRGSRTALPSSTLATRTVAAGRTSEHLNRVTLHGLAGLYRTDAMVEQEYRLVEDHARVQQKLEQREASMQRKFVRELPRGVCMGFRHLAPLVERGVFRPSRINPGKLKGGSSGTSCGWASYQGDREYQQDVVVNSQFHVRHGRARVSVRVLGVCDGHGEAGAECARYVSEQLPLAVKARLELYLRKYDNMQVAVFNALKIASVDVHFRLLNQPMGTTGGSTATLAFRIGNDLWVSCTGDSPAVLMSSEGRVEPLTEDAEPDQPEYMQSAEKRGLKSAQTLWGTSCITDAERQQYLAMTRSFGDGYLQGGLSARPKIRRYRLRGGESMVIGSDGLFEKQTPKQVGELAHTLLKHDYKPASVVAGLLVKVADEAAKYENDHRPRHQGIFCTDNATAVVSWLR